MKKKWRYCEQPVYRLVGFSRRSDGNLGSCIYTILLSSDFAREALAFKATDEQRTRMVEICKDVTGDPQTRLHFFKNSFFISSMSVSGNCCCTGISGNNHNPDGWGDVIRYDGHNIDSRQSAFDLLAAFTAWVDIAETIMRKD